MKEEIGGMDVLVIYLGRFFILFCVIDYWGIWSVVLISVTFSDIAFASARLWMLALNQFATNGAKIT